MPFGRDGTERSRWDVVNSLEKTFFRLCGTLQGIERTGQSFSPPKDQSIGVFGPIKQLPF